MLKNTRTRITKAHATLLARDGADTPSLDAAVQTALNEGSSVRSIERLLADLCPAPYAPILIADLHVTIPAREDFRAWEREAYATDPTGPSVHAYA